MMLLLPYPPSVNAYWRSLRSGPLAGRVLLSKKARAYHGAVGRALMLGQAAGRGWPMMGRLSLRILAHPPDGRRRDLDNILKALLDSLVRAKVIGDDFQIEELSLRWGEKFPPFGEVLVMLGPASPRPLRALEPRREQHGDLHEDPQEHLERR